MIKLNNELTIHDNENYLFVYEDIKASYDLLRKISGINKSTYTHNDTPLYDNEDYFSKRIYIENNIEYLNTLSKNAIKEEIEKIYNKKFDSDKFAKLINDTRARLGLTKNYKYNFTKEKLNLVNVCFALAFNNIKIFPYMLANIEDQYALSKLNQFMQSEKSIISIENFSNIYKYNLNFNIVFVYNDGDNLKFTLVNRYETYYRTKQLLYKDEIDNVVYKKDDEYILDYKIKDNKPLYNDIKIRLKKYKIGDKDEK